MGHDVPAYWFLAVSHHHSITLVHHLISDHHRQLKLISNLLQTPQELPQSILPHTQLPSSHEISPE